MCEQDIWRRVEAKQSAMAARIAELEAALRPLARAFSTEFGTGDDEPDDSNVFAGEIDGQGITFGLIRNALRALGELD